MTDLQAQQSQQRNRQVYRFLSSQQDWLRTADIAHALRFSLSRHQVRRALLQLTREGAIERRRNVGRWEWRVM